MIYNQDCVVGARRYLKDNSIDLVICDPPFSIDETKFKNLYNRDNRLIIPGYAEAPTDYASFSLSWIGEAKRVLKPQGSLYIVSGWSNLRHVLNALDFHEMHLRNHIIWKYDFGVRTQKKFVTSHYHILYVTHSERATPVFNTNCRFDRVDRTESGRSA